MGMEQDRYAPKDVRDRVMVEARKLVGGDELKVRQLFSRSSWAWFQRTWGVNVFFIGPDDEDSCDYGAAWEGNVIDELREIVVEGDETWQNKEFVLDVIDEMSDRPWFTDLYLAMCEDLGGTTFFNSVLEEIAKMDAGNKSEINTFMRRYSEVRDFYGRTVGKSFWEWDKNDLLSYLGLLMEERDEQAITDELLGRLADDTREVMDIAFRRKIFVERNGQVYFERQVMGSPQEFEEYCRH